MNTNQIFKKMSELPSRGVTSLLFWLCQVLFYYMNFYFMKGVLESAFLTSATDMITKKYTYFQGVFKSSLPCWDLRSCFPSAEWHFSNCNFCCQSLLIIIWKIIFLGKLSLKQKHLTDSSNEKYCMLCLLSRALPTSH